MSLQTTLFGSTQYKPIRISDPLQKSIDITTGDSMDRYRRRKGETLDAFQAVAGRTLPKVERAADTGLAEFGRASSMLSSFNPMATYERIRGGNLSALTGLSDALAGVGRRQERTLAARLGLAGRPTSSARDLLRSSGTATAFAPIANSIFNNLGSDASSIGRMTGAQAQQLTALAMARPDLYGSILQYAMAPLDAERTGLMTETEALNSLGDAVKKNYAGMDVQKKMGIMDYPVRMTENLSATVGNLADAAGSVMSIAGPLMGGMGGLGGMMGGMGGGMGGMGGMFGGGGGGGRGSASNPNLNWGSWSPAGGGFGGGSNPVDVNSMNALQMLMLQNAMRYGSQNVPAGSVWE